MPNTAIKTKSFGLKPSRSLAAEPIVALLVIVKPFFCYCISANPKLSFNFGSVALFKGKRSAMRPSSTRAISSHAEQRNS